MSEWLIRCADDLKSGAYYASVDIHDGERPVMILFKIDGKKTFVVGQGEPVNPHGRLIDADAVDTGYSDPEVVLTLEDAPTVIPASE